MMTYNIASNKNSMKKPTEFYQSKSKVMKY